MALGLSAFSFTEKTKSETESRDCSNQCEEHSTNHHAIYTRIQSTNIKHTDQIEIE